MEDRFALLARFYPELNDWLASWSVSPESRDKTRSKSDTNRKGAQAKSSPTIGDHPVGHHLDMAMAELVERLKGNYPFHSEIYAGQMLKPSHEIAWAAYTLASIINPNNHALDGGPPTSQMEKEVIPQFARMFGYDHPSLGHLTSSGTIANLEALWVSREIHPDKKVAYSSQAHFTHARMCRVLGVDHVEIPVDAFGNWDMDYLHRVLPEIGTLVVTMGTTGFGRVEPLHELLPICQNAGVRIHLDAAYGGYFKILSDAGEVDPRPWSDVNKADSIVIDPHKHGLQPYGCGCILFRDPEVGRMYKHDSPYTYFSSEELHLGEISLECSRAGASAAALWTTLRLFGLEHGGPMHQVLKACRQAAHDFATYIGTKGNYLLLGYPELDIVVYAPVRGVNRLSDVTTLSQKIFREGMSKGTEGYFLSLITISAEQFTAYNTGSSRIPLELDVSKVTVLRSVLMKPEHLRFVQTLVERLDAAATSLS